MRCKCSACFFCECTICIMRAYRKLSHLQTNAKQCKSNADWCKTVQCKYKATQCKTLLNKAKQSKTIQNNATHSKTKQCKSMQINAKHSKSKESNACPSFLAQDMQKLVPNKLICSAANHTTKRTLQPTAKPTTKKSASAARPSICMDMRNAQNDAVSSYKSHQARLHNMMEELQRVWFTVFDSHRTPATLRISFRSSCGRLEGILKAIVCDVLQGTMSDLRSETWENSKIHLKHSKQNSLITTANLCCKFRQNNCRSVSQISRKKHQTFPPGTLFLRSSFTIEAVTLSTATSRLTW